MAVDSATLRALADVITTVGDEVVAAPIATVNSVTCSALNGLDGPRRAAAEVQRLGSALREWAVATRRSVEHLVTSDDHNVDRLRH